MIAWFLALPVEQRAWLLLGAALVLTGLAVGVATWAEARYQRHRDRVERHAQTTDWVTPPAVTAPMRRLSAQDRADITEDQRMVRLEDGMGEV